MNVYSYFGSPSYSSLLYCSVIPGGLTEERKVDPKDPTDQHVIQITEEMWGAAEEMAGKKFDKFIAVSYRSQVVAGVNYFIKVSATFSHKYAHYCCV